MIELVIPGPPVTQGSYAIMRGRIVTTPQVKDYRARTAAAAAAIGVPAPVGGPVQVVAIFGFTRPKTHRTATGLRAGAPPYPTGRGNGDLDKLTRALLDALVEARCLVDDSHVVDLQARKVWASAPATLVTITPAETR